jgi:glucose-6-phosphate isomerase/transaldolase/glucose-6-phosphate isomerase
VPAALLGVDVARLLERARSTVAACGPHPSATDNPALRLGAILGGFAGAGRDKVTLVLSPSIAAFGAWLEQMLTESTGKKERGLVVVHDEPLGPAEVYGSDRLFVSITLGGDADVEQALAPIEKAGHPVVRRSLADRSDLGGEFFRWEMATAAAAIVLGVNAFDDPDVGRAKDATRAALATFMERGRLPEWPRDDGDELARTLAGARPGDYVALLAYLTPEPAITAALAKLRALLRDGTRLATTRSYGPRYLHSTGQLHKGGPPTPILVLLTRQDAEELPIPGERYGFATLELAQALGDLSTLRATHRRALWLELTAPADKAIHELIVALERKVTS